MRPPAGRARGETTNVGPDPAGVKAKTWRVGCKPDGHQSSFSTRIPATFPSPARWTVSACASSGVPVTNLIRASEAGAPDHSGVNGWTEPAGPGAAARQRLP